MKFFTRKFITGALGEKQMKAAIGGYARHLDQLQLSPDLSALSQINFHDAYILNVIPTSNAKLSVRFRTGNIQGGYTDAAIEFTGVRITARSLQLLIDSVRPSHVEALAAEIDRTKHGFQFRILLWPKGQVTIAFENVGVKLRKAASRSSK